MGFLFVRLPTSFLPDEDQGFLICLVQLPPGATEDRTIQVLRQMEDHFRNTRKTTVEGDHRGRLQLRRTRPEHGPRLRPKLKDWKRTQIGR
jgi:multidrug efflux pump subunit AcrB